MSESVVPTTADGVTLAVHVATGFLALGAGAGALLTEKGGRRHRRFGRFFVYGMTVVVATTAVLYALDPTTTRLFLLLVAAFSYYFVFSGYRVLSRKRRPTEAELVDWIAVGVLTVAGFGLVVMGGWLAANGVDFAAVLLVFGAIAAVFGAIDVRNFRNADGDADAAAWVLVHLQRMIAAYIATVTAVSTVNLQSVPVVVRWLWPTAVGVPLILYLTHRYESGASTPTA